MGKTQKKTGKGRLDKYYYLAKEQGYRARSAFKLIHLNKKYNFLAKARVLIDLCAAPGGWMQVASKHMPANSIIIGVDLDPIKPIPRCISFVEDITTDKCRATLRGELKQWKADVVLHDGAPNVGSAWLQDAYTQSELTLSALKLACDFLTKGGTFVTKVFRSQDYNSLIWVFSQLFHTVEATKPPSSRNVSAEIFVVCQGFKSVKIDPKFLDPKYVFKQLDLNSEEKIVEKNKNSIMNDLLHPEKKRRQRDGYADNDYTLYHATKVSDFIFSDDPIDILARSSALVFKDDEQSKEIYKNPLTTDDIKVNCDDLKVLSKKEYKLLLKWRESIRRYMGLDKKKEEKKEEVAVEEEENSSDEERRVMKELNDIKKDEAKKIKKQKKKDRKAKAKVIKKMQMGMEAPFEIGIEAGNIGQGDSEHLFSINNIGKESNANILRNSSVNSIPEIDDHGDLDIYYGSDPEEDLSESESDSDMDEEEKRLKKLEKSMDMIYEFHKDRQMSREAKVKAKNEKMNRFEEWNGVEEEVRKLTEKQLREKGENDDSSDSDSEKDIKREGNNLSKKAKLFFSNDVFKGIDLHEGEEDDEDEDEEEEEEEEEEIEEDVEEEQEQEKKNKKEKKRKRNEVDDDDFEVVPIAQTYESDEEMDYTLMDPEAYTMAQKLITKKGKRDLIDDSYNRRTHYYTDGLPEWFLNDEREYNKPPQKPVTKEAVKIVRDKLKALNARPIKKVAEARARKKMKAINKLEKIKKKAAVMWDNDADGEMNDKQKLQTIQKMINNAGKKKKNEVKLVVAKGFNRGIKGRPKGVKGRYKMVDARMKKELRAAKRREKENKKRRR
ncbi:hypothetical protein PIROE2DRAFT_38108 [Piromyces sp. E2]|nr:hypothetical protein PIROE2DRAFT_38108 [Piromyces sp. E2]|eukprot:OUM69459.1 hypothetical protein PIROE2DRAFT_38108 [Piromyces sp. E2]